MNYLYVISRVNSGVLVIVQDKNDGEHILEPRLDLFRHSPSGFEFGYNGPGPAQLSLAILAHHFSNPKNLLPFESFVPDSVLKDTKPGDTLAIMFHQKYKSRVISLVPVQLLQWVTTSNDIDQFLIGLLMPKPDSV